MIVRDSDLLTKYEEAKCIVVFCSVLAVGSCDAKKGRNNSTEATVEETKCRKDSIRISITQYELPLSRYDHADT